MEYLIAHYGGRGLSYVYELNLAGENDRLAGSKRPQNGQLAGGSRVVETRMNTAPNGVFVENREKRTALGAS
jgi:hypothetical protein